MVSGSNWRRLCVVVHVGAWRGARLSCSGARCGHPPVQSAYVNALYIHIQMCPYGNHTPCSHLGSVDIAVPGVIIVHPQTHHMLRLCDSSPQLCPCDTPSPNPTGHAPAVASGCITPFVITTPTTRPTHRFPNHS